jgi:SAM-dependent methyltransferase
VLFAVRLLHHAPRPRALVASLARLLKPAKAGAAVFVDYARHEDESMRDQADVWLGFEPAELTRFARDAKLTDVHVTRIPAPGRGPDAHLPWQVMTARRL